MNWYKKIAHSSLILLFCIVATLFCLSLNLNNNHKGLLSISFLNIGQGDAIFIEAPNGNQILVDGGPDKIILRELGKVMPIFDRSIDALLISNPDKDHIGGFIDVMQRYNVQNMIEPGTISNSDTFKTIKKLEDEKNITNIVARRGMNIVLDEERDVYIKVLFPDRDVSSMETNDGSIIAKLVYGNTSILLQGDAPQNIERYLLFLNKDELDTDILKVGHHGSRTSTYKDYVLAASPVYAVISLGKDNKYGHPHKETIDTLNDLGVPVLRTDTEGRISFVSDGVNWKRD